jgi:hypothetical protein
MTPYEGALAKKLTQATELSDNLLRWVKTTGRSSPPEEPILRSLIQQIEQTNRQYNRQLHWYEELTDKRNRLVQESENGIKSLTDRLWEDSCYQFKSGMVANDLIKVLYYKIHRLPLPAFPVNRRRPVLCKEVRLYEDSYALLGQYFGWLIDLLQLVNFTPIRPPYCLKSLRQQANQFNLLTVQVAKESETMRNLQLTQHQLYKQLNQAMGAVRGRLLTYKREARQIER